MRRLLFSGLVSAALTLGLVLCLHDGIAHQSLTGAGARSKVAGGGACSPDQWNASDKGADITLSGSPCKLTFAGGDPTNFEIVRSVNSHTGTSTSYYFEFTINSISGDVAIGLADLTENLGPSPSTYCGFTTDSVGLNAFNGDILRNNTTATTMAAAVAGDIVGVAADMSSISGSWAVYFRIFHGGSWSSLSPAVALPSTAGTTIKVCGSSRNSNANVTVNFSATPIGGYSAWN